MAVFKFIEGLCEVQDTNVARPIAIPEEGRHIEG